MTVISSFAPVSHSDAKVLILGSMPGVASLQAQQYYAHPRNAFWSMILHVFKAERNLSYEDRLQILRDHKIALWDVLENCTREGSLDSAIRDEVPNDFQTFMADHPSITHIFFNGKKAWMAFEKLVMPTLDLQGREIVFSTLPSTSPANASHNFHAKLAIWRQIAQV